MRMLLGVVACPGLVMGQSATADRQKASDYPASASAGRVEIGAEFLVHSIPASRGYYFAKGYLVVDVGIFPKPGVTTRVSASQFSLRLNGQSSVLMTQSPGMVAASLKYPDWGMPSGLSGRATVGHVAIDSDPRPVGRFPNDPHGRSPDDGAVNPNQDDAPDHQLSLVALPDAASERPVKGCVFFASGIMRRRSNRWSLSGPGPRASTLF